MIPEQQLSWNHFCIIIRDFQRRKSTKTDQTIAHNQHLLIDSFMEHPNNSKSKKERWRGKVYTNPKDIENPLRKASRVTPSLRRIKSHNLWVEPHCLLLCCFSSQRPHSSAALSVPLSSFVFLSFALSVTEPWGIGLHLTWNAVFDKKCRNRGGEK